MSGSVRRGRVLSVFSGLGGLDVGLELAGFDNVLCLDTETTARESLRKNRSEWRVPEDGDVLLAAKRYPPGECGLRRGELDLLAGGPPCQPFSKAAQWNPNSRVGLEDPRARAIDGMLNLVETYLPKAVLIENVPGFLAGPTSVGRYFNEALRSINSAHGTGYHLFDSDWKVLDAASFGVPQHRKRAIAVLLRNGDSFEFPLPTHSASLVTAWDALCDVCVADAPRARGQYADLLPSIPEGSNYLWLTDRGEGAEVFGYRTRYWSFLLKLAKDRPSWTLPASPGPSTGPFHWNNRPLSVAERMRLQSIPDDWTLVGTERDKWRLIGNATPPRLAYVLGRAIGRTLGLGRDAAPSGVLVPRLAPGTPPPPAQPAEVPAKYRQLIGPKLAHAGVGLGPAPRISRLIDSEGVAVDHEVHAKRAAV